MKEFRERLIELREEHDLNKVALAELIGVSKSAITRYESGEISPTLEVMLRIKKAFGKSLDWIAGYEEDKQQNISAEYSNVINECIKSDITPLKLYQIIKVFNK